MTKVIGKDGWLKRLGNEFDIKFGPWIKYGNHKDNDNTRKMNELVTESWSPFNGCEMVDVFIFCMSYSFGRGRVPVKPPGSGALPAHAFNSEMRNFMKIVAIAHKKDLDVITDPKEVIKICENFAYASFEEVYDKIKNRDSSIQVETILESMIQEIKPENDQNKQLEE